MEDALIPQSMQITRAETEETDSYAALGPRLLLGEEGEELVEW